MIRVLYVDDYTFDRELVRDALENEETGFRVTEATCQRELEERLAEAGYDVVLSDLHLGELSGFDVIDLVLARSPHLPVVIVTGTGSEAEAVEAMRRGAADYVIKTPHHIRRLPRTILAALERQRLLAAQRRADEALLESARQWQATFDALGDYICLLDSEGKIMRCNRSCASFLNAPSDEVAGRPCREAIHDCSEPGRSCALARMLVTLQRETEVLQHGDKWFGVAVDPLFDRGGKLAGAVHIMTDVSTLQQQALELEVINKELEAHNYTVAHDLKTPLRAMDGFSRWLLELYGDRLDAEGKKYLGAVRRGSQRMAEYLDALLDLSRLSVVEMKREEVDLSRLVAKLAKDLQSIDPARQVEFVIAPGLTGRGDPSLLGSMLQNLLDNAWKFTSKHPKARIEFGATGDGVLFVRDDGAGFDMQCADKLFVAFQRMHHDWEFPGLGVGLASAQRIVRRHGGRVWIEAKPEEGATVYFTFANAGPATRVGEGYECERSKPSPTISPP